MASDTVQACRVAVEYRETADDIDTRVVVRLRAAGVCHAGVDVCMRKPLVAATSVDRSVRIWNWQEMSLELVKQFQDEAYSIAIHPNGLMVVVGFADKLRLMSVLLDDLKACCPADAVDFPKFNLHCYKYAPHSLRDRTMGEEYVGISPGSVRVQISIYNICVDVRQRADRKSDSSTAPHGRLIPSVEWRPASMKHFLLIVSLGFSCVQLYREFSVKQCREVRFSHGGHLFAAVNGTTINVYDTYTADTVAILRGHSGAAPWLPSCLFDSCMC